MRNGLFIFLLLLAACAEKTPMCVDDNSLPVPAEGYVALEGGHFVVDGEEWFPPLGIPAAG